MTHTRSDLLGTYAARRAVNSGQNSFTQWASDNGSVGVAVGVSGTPAGPCLGLAVQALWEVTAASATTYALTIDVLGSQDGTHYDTEPYCSMVIGLSVTGAQTKMATMAIPFPEDLASIQVRATASVLASATSNVWLSLLRVTQ